MNFGGSSLLAPFCSPVGRWSRNPRCHRVRAPGKISSPEGSGLRICILRPDYRLWWMVYTDRQICRYIVAMHTFMKRCNGHAVYALRFKFSIIYYINLGSSDLSPFLIHPRSSFHSFREYFLVQVVMVYRVHALHAC